MIQHPDLRAAGRSRTKIRWSLKDLTSQERALSRVHFAYEKTRLACVSRLASKSLVP